LDPAQELEHEGVEREGVLDGEAVGRAGDDREIGRGDALDELLSVGSRREDVLAARDDERRHSHLDEPIAQRVVGVEDGACLRSERVGGDVQRERAEHTESRPVPTQRARADEPPHRPPADFAHALLQRDRRPLGEELATPHVVMASSRTEHE
jgi:hypothetical protein